MAVRFEGAEVQTDRDVRELLDNLRKDPRTENPRVLTVLQERQMQARNGGYPIFMHHDSLSPVRVENEKEEMNLTEAGFRREYKHRSFPTWIHRRNMHPKFAKSAQELIRLRGLSPEAQRLEMAQVNDGDFIESVQVKDEVEFAKYMKQPEQKAAGIGKWHHEITDVEPLETPDEDPQLTIARMEGELAALREKAGRKKEPSAA